MHLKQVRETHPLYEDNPKLNICLDRIENRQVVEYVIQVR